METLKEMQKRHQKERIELRKICPHTEVKVYDKDPDKALEKMIELELKCQEKFGEKSE